MTGQVLPKFSRHISPSDVDLFQEKHNNPLPFELDVVIQRSFELVDAIGTVDEALGDKTQHSSAAKHSLTDVVGNRLTDHEVPLVVANLELVILEQAKNLEKETVQMYKL